MAQWQLNVRPSVIQLRPVQIAAVAAITTTLSLASLPTRPAMAQAPTPPPSTDSAARPAGLRDFFFYSQMGAINVCVLSANKVGFDKSLPAAIEMVVSAIVAGHGGIIQGVNNNQKLEPNQLANGTLTQIIPRVKEMCEDKLSPADKKTVADLMAQIQKAAGSQQGGGK